MHLRDFVSMRGIVTYPLKAHMVLRNVKTDKKDISNCRSYLWLMFNKICGFWEFLAIMAQDWVQLDGNTLTEDDEAGVQWCAMDRFLFLPK